MKPSIISRKHLPLRRLLRCSSLDCAASEGSPLLIELVSGWGSEGGERAVASAGTVVSWLEATLALLGGDVGVAGDGAAGCFHDRARDSYLLMTDTDSAPTFTIISACRAPTAGFLSCPLAIQLYALLTLKVGSMKGWQRPREPPPTLLQLLFTMKLVPLGALLSNVHRTMLG
ncbi:hypothetical protein MSAN_02205400 [Mycena sanguinolenta]|uniref:Uncharacterized protein n=1 Tax=Mycena sanguinolenta TaxID=230812 RepID=A0A8H6XE15_9AGAR|nr:hypothetical protein MSAN_02205400 [Mycena sanguinolenta]